MRRQSLLLLVLVAFGCVTLTPDGKRVSVYTAPHDAPPAGREMPDGCRKLGVLPEEWMSELEMDGQAEPFLKQRNAAAAAGANTLLALKKLTGARRDPECPGAVPIRDCAPNSGAWYMVEFETYQCTPDALKTLNTPKNPPKAP